MNFWMHKTQRMYGFVGKYQLFNDDPGARDLDMQTQAYYILWVFPPRAYLTTSNHCPNLNCTKG